MPFAWGLYVAPKGILLPLASSPDYLSALKNMIEQFKIEAIIPGTQAEIETILIHRREFDIPIITNRSDLVPLMMNKLLLDKALAKLGMPFVETQPLENWRALAARVGFPLVIKPALNSGSSRGVYLVADELEIERLIPMLDPTCKPCVQPYVESDKTEYTVGILSDKDGDLVDSIVIRRELVGLSLLNSRKIGSKRYSISSGYSQGHIVRNKPIQDFCEKIAMAMGSQGPLNLQLRVDKGNIYVFEIHPRFSGTTPMRADVGFNEVDLLLRNHLHGEKFGRVGYRSNMTVIRAFEHVVVPTSNLLRRDPWRQRVRGPHRTGEKVSRKDSTGVEE